MSNRVNITYSVEFDEILEVMKGLITKSYNSNIRSVEVKFAELTKSLDSKHEKEALQSIDEMRKNLVDFDMRLNDCFGIIAEYQRTLLSPDSAEVEDDPSG